MIAKTTSERVQALRQRREALGLTRLELYVHPDDHEAVKALAAKLFRKRRGRIDAPIPQSAQPLRGTTDGPPARLL